MGNHGHNLVGVTERCLALHQGSSETRPTLDRSIACGRRESPEYSVCGRETSAAGLRS
jgi:hypothetical protein